MLRADSENLAGRDCFRLQCLSEMHIGILTTFAGGNGNSRALGRARNARWSVQGAGIDGLVTLTSSVSGRSGNPVSDTDGRLVLAPRTERGLGCGRGVPISPNSVTSH